MIESIIRHRGRAIFRLWWHWTVGVGALTALMCLTVVLPKLWLPLLGLVLYLRLRYVIRRDRTAEFPYHDRMLDVCARAIFWSMVVMVIINLCHTRWLDFLLLNPERYNKEIPFVSVLIVAPATFLSSLMAVIHPVRNPRYLYPHGHGFLSTLAVHDTRMQLRVLCTLSGLMTALTWAYYFLFYINTNFNTPDWLMFRWFPLVVYVLSITTLSMRYVGIWQYYMKEVATGTVRHGDSTKLRFLIMHDDCLYLTPRKAAVAGGDEVLDTPLSVYVHRTESLSAPEAKQIAMKHLDLKPDQVTVRFIYSGGGFNSDCNVLHFAAMLKDANHLPEGGRWYTLREINHLHMQGHVSRLLMSELRRIYTVATAWKTYDRDGRRLYPVRNYRPSLNLRDFLSWDVDFDDPTWLTVAAVNEDKRLYRLRRIVERVIK